MNKQTNRKCIGCFETKNREEMVKITREHKSGEIFINPNSKIFGRSVYLCYNGSCIEDSLKKNKLAKFLKAGLTEELKETLRAIHKERERAEGVGLAVSGNDSPSRTIRRPV